MMKDSAMQRLTHTSSRLKRYSLSVQPTHGQPKPEPGNGTQARLDALARYLAKKVDIPRCHRTTCTDMLLRGIWSTTIPIPTPTAITRVSVPAAAPGSAGGTPAGSSECVREDTSHVAGCDAAALVANA
jgi:hypothetical protein